jgi:carboxypeptidase family protein
MRRLLLFVFLAASLLAQQSGTISGTITDPEGRALPRIPVLAVNETTKTVSRATSSAAGEYSISQLPAGTYSVTTQVLANSYRPFARSGMRITAGQTVKLDIRMQEGIALNTLGDGREFFQDVARATLPKIVIPSGSTPRMQDGKPDFSGYWSAAGGSSDLGLPEFQDWAVALAIKRQADDLRDLPGTLCQPNGIVLAVNNATAQRIVHIPGLLVMYSEGQLPRQIFLDGRGHPSDPNPTWRGHSIGRWDGDTLIADTVGFNDRPWLDWSGHSQTEKLHVVERFRRPDLGHLELEMRLEDTGALKAPWTIKRTYILDPKEDVLENVCTENEKDAQHLFKK